MATGTATAMPITLTPAHHFSARTPFDRDRALWGGFALVAGRTRIYFAGDTAYAPFFPEVPRRLGPIDLALLPIGAYEPRWFMRAVHMNPDEAVQAHLDLGAPESIGMHFGTFQLTTEGIDEPLRALEAACRARGVAASRFRTLGFGDSARAGSALQRFATVTTTRPDDRVADAHRAHHARLDADRVAARTRCDLPAEYRCALAAGKNGEGWDRDSGLPIRIPVAVGAARACWSSPSRRSRSASAPAPRSSAW